MNKKDNFRVQKSALSKRWLLIVVDEKGREIFTACFTYRRQANECAKTLRSASWLSAA